MNLFFGTDIQAISKVKSSKNLQPINRKIFTECSLFTDKSNNEIDDENMGVMSFNQILVRHRVEQE